MRTVLQSLIPNIGRVVRPSVPRRRHRGRARPLGRHRGIGSAELLDLSVEEFCVTASGSQAAPIPVGDPHNRSSSRKRTKASRGGVGGDGWEADVPHPSSNYRNVTRRGHLSALFDASRGSRLRLIGAERPRMRHGNHVRRSRPTTSSGLVIMESWGAARSTHCQSDHERTRRRESSSIGCDGCVQCT